MALHSFEAQPFEVVIRRLRTEVSLPTLVMSPPETMGRTIASTRPPQLNRGEQMQTGMLAITSRTAVRPALVIEKPKKEMPLAGEIDGEAPDGEAAPGELAGAGDEGAEPAQLPSEEHRLLYAVPRAAHVVALLNAAVPRSQG